MFVKMAIPFQSNKDKKNKKKKPRSYTPQELITMYNGRKVIDVIPTEVKPKQ